MSSAEPLSVWVPGGGAFVEATRAAIPSAVQIDVDEHPPPHGETHICVSGLPRASWLRACPKLRAVVIPYAGVPARTVQCLQAFPHVALHNLHHNAQATAEMAVALMLAVAKHVVPLDQRLRTGDWRPRYEPPQARMLSGRTALVWGWGAIGRRIGRACRGLGMPVVGVRRRPSEETSEGCRVTGLASIEKELPHADVLFLALPATDQTRSLVDARRLALLPKGALLINVARGSVVDEQALYSSLASGALGGAGLDVWWRYPRAGDDRSMCAPSYQPFQQLPNVVFSPHRGGMTQETEDARGSALAELLNAAATGEPIPNAVSLAEGY